MQNCNIGFKLKWYCYSTCKQFRIYHESQRKYKYELFDNLCRAFYAEIFLQFTELVGVLVIFF